MGNVDIGIFLAVMEVGTAILNRRIQSALVRMMFGIENLRAVPDPRTVIFPAHKFGQTGIEVRREGKPSYYFWTGQRSSLLRRLAAAGFQVSAQDQKMSYRRAKRVLGSAAGSNGDA